MRWPVDRGNATGKAASEMQPGEFSVSTGAAYLPGASGRIHKQNGRALFGTAESGKRILGLALAQYDDGSDKLLAYANTTIYKATPGLTGTFSALISSLSSDAAHFSVAHAQDRWYIANGQDTIRVVESDDSTYPAGMQPPQEAQVATTGNTVVATVRATSASGFTGSAYAYDANRDTFASGTLSQRGTTATLTTSFSAVTPTAAAGRVLTVEWGLSSSIVERGGRGQLGDLGAVQRGGWMSNVRIRVSEDAGVTYTTYMDARYDSPQNRQVFQRPVTASSELVRVQVELEYNTGEIHGNVVTLQAFDHRIDETSSMAVFTTSSDGLTYAVTEYDEERGDESPPGPLLNVTLTAKNRVDLTLPSPARNTRSTHWRIYRTADGGVAPQDLGLLAQVPIATTTYRDDFTAYAYNEQPTQIIPLLGVTSQDTTLYFSRDNPPPVVEWLSFFKGSLVGLFGRGLYYSIPGRPSSWPAIYVIDNFGLPEHDNLLRGEELGGSFVVWASGVVFRIDEVPRVVQGILNASEVVSIKGAPGLAGRYGVAMVPMDGEAHAAWIAEDGIYITNGHTYRRITRDVAWDFGGLDKSKWALHWDNEQQVLRFSYATTGTEPNRYWTASLAPEHLVNGQPKWTGPHYGKLACIVSGHVSTTRRIYSGNTDDGKVYVEDYGGTDASNSYDSSGTWPLILTTGKVYNEYEEWVAMKGSLRHGDFGTGETCTIAWRAGRDQGAIQSRTLNSSLAGENAAEFDIARSGDWHEWTLTHLGTGRSWVQDMRLEVLAGAQSGNMQAVPP